MSFLFSYIGYTDSRHYRPKITKTLYYQSMHYSNWLLATITQVTQVFLFNYCTSSSDVVPLVADALFATSLMSQTLSYLVDSSSHPLPPWLLLSQPFLCRPTGIFIFPRIILVEFLGPTQGFNHANVYNRGERESLAEGYRDLEKGGRNSIE